MKNILISFCKQNKLAILILVGAIGFAIFLVKQEPASDWVNLPPLKNEALAARFDFLKSHGNSSCSSSFQNTVSQMPDSSKIMGSCCSPMSMHRYQEQIEGLKKYKNIEEIPQDPYAIDAGLAKKFWKYYDLELAGDQQAAYDYAMINSHEKGPCCCKCWRWFVYGGLAKHLIKERGFTGEQITDLWNLSDGCGGDEEHHHG